MDELRLVCMSEQPHVVCIVETWLDENILESEITLWLGWTEIDTVVALSCTSCVLVTSNSFRICIGGLLYRPPSSSVFVLDNLFSVLESLEPSYFSNFVLIGDFNIDYNSSFHPLRQRLDTIVSSFSFVQVVADPTPHQLQWTVFSH